MFFFFQAEDGIRDLYVTGVQTCALPISSSRATGSPPTPAWRWKLVSGPPSPAAPTTTPTQTSLSDRRPRGAPRWTTRSEERRVGKECRSRRTPEHLKEREKTGKQERRQT